MAEDNEKQSKKKQSASSSRAPRNDDPLLIRTVPPQINQETRIDNRRNPLKNVGRGDLDPFSKGDGSIFHPQFGTRPYRPAGLHPRARFYPVYPFRRFQPDNDHIRPPH